METLRLGLEWFLNPDHVPLLIAREAGILARLGLHLELVEPREHMDALGEIRAGRLDVAVTEPIHLLQDLARGQAAIGFARFLHTTGGVMYLRGKGIERPRDMAGKRVQYPGAPGPGGLAIVRTMIEADGGPKDAPLVPVNCGFQHTTALLEDAADVATLVFHNFECVEARGRGAEPGLFLLDDWGVPDFCQLILITTPDTFASRRGALAKLVTALREGIALARHAPDDVRRLWEKASGQDASAGLGKAIYDATLPCFVRDFGMAEAYYERLGEWLVGTGQAERAVPAREAWTNALAY
jgi:ABC-type nitrate/sulfonate/bicarbonate transport system substrate-binding protein